MPCFHKIGCHGNALEISKRGPDRSSTAKTLSFGEKIAKIGPVDPEIIVLRAIIKKKKLMQAKYNPSGKFDVEAVEGRSHKRAK